MASSDQEALIKKCRDKEFYAYGTSRIFEQRARRYSRGRALITYFGIVIPLLVGASAMAFGADSQWFPILLYSAGTLGIIQLAISVWSVVDRWDERYEQAMNSAKANTRLYNQWKQLSEYPSDKLSQLIEGLSNKDQDQEQEDLAQHISEKEKRFAMHESLFYYGKPCPACKEVPKTKKPSDCDMCGNY